MKLSTPTLNFSSLYVTHWSVTREKTIYLVFEFRLYNFVSGLTVKRITRISQQNKFKLNREKQTALEGRVLIQFLLSVNRSPWSLYSSKLRGIRTWDVR